MSVYYIELTRFNSPPSICERKVDETEKRERRQRSRGERRGRKTFFQSFRLFSNRKHGGGGRRRIHQRGEWIATNDGSYFESNQSPYNKLLWSTGGGGDVTWQYGETHTRLKASISRTKQIPRQIGRFSLRTAGLPTFSIRPHSVRGIR